MARINKTKKPKKLKKLSDTQKQVLSNLWYQPEGDTFLDGFREVTIDVLVGEELIEFVSGKYHLTESGREVADRIQEEWGLH